MDWKVNLIDFGMHNWYSFFRREPLLVLYDALIAELLNERINHPVSPRTYLQTFFGGLDVPAELVSIDVNDIANIVNDTHKKCEDQYLEGALTDKLWVENFPFKGPIHKERTHSPKLR